MAEQSIWQPASEEFPGGKSVNRNAMLAVVVIVVAAVGIYSYGRMKSVPAPDLAPVGATLLEGLGTYSMPVASSGADVQRWFDQGLAMTYGFNHDAAERSRVIQSTSAFAAGAPPAGS